MLIYIYSNICFYDLPNVKHTEYIPNIISSVYYTKAVFRIILLIASLFSNVIHSPGVSCPISEVILLPTCSGFLYLHLNIYI